MDLQKLKDIGIEEYVTIRQNGDSVKAMRAMRESFFDGVLETLKELGMDNEVKEWERLLDE